MAKITVNVPDSVKAGAKVKVKLGTKPSSSATPPRRPSTVSRRKRT